MLEREAAIYNLPRAVHFDDEVMRLFQTVGLCGTRCEALVHVSPGMRFVDDAGRLLLDWSRPDGGGATGLARQLPLPPAGAGARAARRAGAVPLGVRCACATEVFAIEQDADGVVLRFEELATGALRHCRAPATWSAATAPGRWCAG